MRGRREIRCVDLEVEAGVRDRCVLVGEALRECAEASAEVYCD
jgi:hypothetical protein